FIMQSNRDVITTGSTGLVGNQILKELLSDETVRTVYSLTRRKLAFEHPKLVQLVVDFKALPTLPAASELYLALGTTIKDAGSQTAFRAVDFDANLAVAKVAQEAGVTHVGVVSAMGANPNSVVFYSRVKGELEQAVEKLGFQGVTIARPSMLLGDRDALGQVKRSNEYYTHLLANLFVTVIPKNYKPIAAVSVAKSLLKETLNTQGVRILLSGEMRDCSAPIRMAS
ncbi:MAG: NAD(P)H-binding protein, partial [Enterovibrio sp.]